MSNRYKGAVISATPPTTTGGESGTASGAWTLEQQMQLQAAGLWPIQPPPLFIENVFSTYVYTGTGATNNIVNGINLSGKGGLVWTKARTTTSAFTFAHALIDTVRGVGIQICSDRTDANTTQANSLTAFNANGYTLGADTGQGRVNNTSYGTQTYVSWTFREQPKFFDIVTYNGTGVDMAVNHNLQAQPGCVIIKRLNAVSDWQVMFPGLISDGYGGTGRMSLNTTAAYSATGWTSVANSTQITIPTNTPAINEVGGTYVAYLFASNAGGFGLTESENAITCGSYTGNGAAGGQLINLGYEAQWVMIKNSSSGGDWWMLDNMRGWTVNGDFGSDQTLFANSSGAESGQVAGEPASQGFRPIQDNVNASGNTYIYIAIRRGPMAVPTVGTNVFKVETYNQTSASDPAFNLGKVADMGFRRLSDFESSWSLQTRLTGNNGLVTNTTDAEANQPLGFWDNMVGWYQGNAITPPYSQANWYGWTFARAPGFFDVVCYTGTGSARTINHNLAAVPEMMIVKCRSTGGTNRGWWTYVAPLGNTQALYLNGQDNAQTAGIWNNTTPTSTVFSIDGTSLVNGSGATYIAYLFATCPGVSKVGSYTGTGALLTVNCGFTAGSRFVLIKRTDSTGDWYVYDSVRGITSGNDPYMVMNSTAVQVDGTNYVDTTAVGFQVTAAAPAGLNASGGSYIFLAIA
jgi:hypothetical protein